MAKSGAHEPPPEEVGGIVADIVAGCIHCGYEGRNPHMMGPHHAGDCPRRVDANEKPNPEDDSEFYPTEIEGYSKEGVASRRIVGMFEGVVYGFEFDNDGVTLKVHVNYNVLGAKNLIGKRVSLILAERINRVRQQEERSEGAGQDQE